MGALWSPQALVAASAEGSMAVIAAKDKAIAANNPLKKQANQRWRLLNIDIVIDLLR
jgi:hypothetical protein